MEPNVNSKTETCCPHRIMLVDDEQNIVNAARRDLMSSASPGKRYLIETFTNPEQALERAHEEPFSVVVSDYRMPGMSGLAFLRELSKLQPDCVRIVLSGQTDFEALTKLINEIQIYRFIQKPWNSSFLRKSIDQAINFNSITRRNRSLASQLRHLDASLSSVLPEPISHVLIVNDDVSVANAINRSLVQRTSLTSTLPVGMNASADTFQPLTQSLLSVHVAETPERALQMASETNYACFIADSKMSGMDGASLLRGLFKKQPDCACILMVDANDMNALIETLDLANLQACLTKPWHPFELRSAVALALTQRRMLLENRILAEMCEARLHSDGTPE